MGKQVKGKGKKFSGKPGTMPKSPKDWQKTESRDMRKDMRKDDKAYESADNDYRWYVKDEQLLKDFASFPFGYPLGNEAQDTYTPGNSVAYPGIMAHYFVPSVGVSNNENTPVNVAMRVFFAQVRKANSGATNYDPADMMIYVLAMDSINMYFRYMRRAYGLIRAYLQKNRYYPKAIIEAMGIDYQDIVSNMANFRGYMNMYAAKARSLAMPGILSYYARHAWMCDSLYVDSDTVKAQVYMYVPNEFYRFGLKSGGSGKGAGMLTSVPLFTPGTTALTFSDLVNYGDELLNPLLANQDINIMSGDILKAFGEGAMLLLPDVPDDYLCLPSYSKEVLSQMENLTSFGGSYVGGSITQNTEVGTGYIVANPGIKVVLNVPTGLTPTVANAAAAVEEAYAPFNSNSRVLVNMHSQDPTPADVMVATRGTILLDLSTVSNGAGGVDSQGTQYISADIKVSTCGSEIVTNSLMWRFEFNADGDWVLNYHKIQSVMPIFLERSTPGISVYTDIQRFWSDVGMFSTYDWHFRSIPAICSTDNTMDNVVVKFADTPLLDIDNYTYLDRTNLEQMNQLALLSMLTSPQLG